MSLASWWRRRRAAALIKSGKPRNIRIHSVARVPAGDGLGERPYARVAFEFTQVPGPWSMQFYEAADGQDDVLALLEPGKRAVFHESNDGARVRVLVIDETIPLWPR